MCMVVCGININKGIVICLNIYVENNKKSNWTNAYKI